MTSAIKKRRTKHYRVHIDIYNLPSQMFVKAEDERSAIYMAYMAIEGFFQGEAVEITREEYAAADDDLKDAVLG